MAGILFPRAKNAPPELAGFRVQSSVYGLPIPVVYGTARIAGNLIDFTQGNVLPANAKPSKWATPAQTGWTYLASLALALCEGPIDGIGDVWADKDKKIAFTPTAQVRDGWDLKLGTFNQAALGYLSSDAPYQYTAYVAVDLIVLPNNVLPNFSWEVEGLLRFGSGVVDALASDVLEDVLTNEIHGASFPADSLGDLTDYEDYCAAAGFFVSPTYSSLRKTSDVIDELMMATNSAVVWSDGLLKVIPYGDKNLSGHGHTYTPNTTPIYDIVDDDYMAGEGEDPVTVKRKNLTERYNQLFVEFDNRFNEYNSDVREAKNDGDILLNGLLVAPKLSLPLIKTPTVARTVAQIRQQREQYVVNEYHFKTGWKFSLLEPMDLVTLTDSGLGLSFTPVRITEVVELEDGQGIEFTAEDWPFGSASATLYPSESNDGHRPENNIDPGDTVTPIIFNGPTALTNNALELWIAPSGGDVWGGCEVWVSTDLGVTYRRVGQTTEKGLYGYLFGTMLTGDAYPLVDSVNTINVSPYGGTGFPTPGSVSLDDFNALVTLCYCDGEFLAYQNFGAGGPGGLGYMTTLYRGLYGSTIQASVPDSTPFVFCETGLFKLPFPQGVGGQVLYFKFPAFNVYGNALQSLADVSPVVFTIGPFTPTGGGGGGGGGAEIETISVGSTSSPCDGGGATDVTFSTGSMPVGTTFSVQIAITSGTFDGEFVNYDGVTSGDTLSAPFCPGQSFNVTVNAILYGMVIETKTDSFTS